MKFVSNLDPRNYIQINNQYELNKKYKDDFIINIYFIEIHKICIVLRKINELNGWNYNVNITIFDKLHKTSESICLGSSTKNYKKINMYLNTIIFEKKESKQLKIPKIIFQTNRSHYFENDLAYNSIQSFIEFNPDYAYQFFDDIESREFIKEHFTDKYVKYYDILYPGAFKADFFRYCYLYINGGFYFDNKSILLVSLNNIIQENDELLLCQDHHKLGYYNAVMMSVPKHEIFMKLLDAIIYKIDNFQKIYNPFTNRQYSKLDNILSLTGPNLLCEIFNVMRLNYNHHVFMKHDILGNYQNYKNLVVNFKNELILYKNYNHFNIHNPNHYSKLWNKHLLFNKVFINNGYSFIINPNYSKTFNYEDYKFYFINNNVLIDCKNNISDFEFIIINIKSETNKFNISNVFTQNYMFEYKYVNNIDYKINNKSINQDLYKNLKFNINKIEESYYLIILNENNNTNKSQINEEIEIELNKKNVNVTINLINEKYKILKLIN